MSGDRSASKLTTGSLAAAAVTSVAVSMAGVFFKDPAEDSDRIAGSLNTVRTELRAEVDSLRAENSELRKENGSLAGKLAALESRVSTRLGPEGFSNKDARAEAKTVAEIVKRLDQMDAFLQDEIDEVNADVDQIREQLLK